MKSQVKTFSEKLSQQIVSITHKFGFEAVKGRKENFYIQHPNTISTIFSIAILYFDDDSFKIEIKLNEYFDTDENYLVFRGGFHHNGVLQEFTDKLIQLLNAAKSKNEPAKLEEEAKEEE